MSTLHPVTSANVAAIGYEPETQTLRVQFKGPDGKPRPKVYSHKGVPAELHGRLMAADSIGGFYAANVRGKFDTEAADI